MRDSVKALIFYLSETHELPSPIVEFGSRQNLAEIGYADFRPFFKGKQYIGCDLEKGPGVDRIENIEKTSFGDAAIATILCLETIEHVEDPIRAIKEIYRILNRDGILVITSHMYWSIHHRCDYWRFTPKCFKNILLRDFPVKEVYTQGEPLFPHLVAGLASKNEINPFHVDIQELNAILPGSPWGFQLFQG